MLSNANATQKGYWALGAISFFWGTTWIASKIGVSLMPPLQLSAIRQSIAGVLMLSYFFFRKKHRLHDRAELLFHAACGFLLFTLSNGLTTWAVAYVPSFLGALLSCLSPFLWVLIQRVVYGERVKPIVLLGMLIGFVGMILLLSAFKSDLTQKPQFMFGILLCLGAVFSWTGGTLLAIKSRFNTDPYAGAGWQMLFGGLFLFLASHLSGQHTPIRVIPWQAWASIAYLVVVGSLFCFVCYLYALKTLPMELVSIYVYINPMVAIAIGVMVLDEPFTLTMLLGAFITLLGVYLVKRYTRTDTLTENEA
ncbi:MAG: drug/metabolite-transporting permease [Chitinophagaceae bacterium]|nr:drug/metabolite-transporting permease [Chitinophagaceae bacterium]